MVTREEYINALDIVDEFHQQLLSTRVSLKTKTTDWINANHPSLMKEVRLFNILRYADFEYIEDYNKFNFMRLKNAGLKTWCKFEKLRGY